MGVGERRERGGGGDKGRNGETGERQGREKGGCLHYAVGATVNPMATCTLYLG